MDKWSKLVETSRAALVRFPLGAENFCRPLAILRGTEPLSALTVGHVRFLYCCALISFLNFVSGDRALTAF